MKDNFEDVTTDSLNRSVTNITFRFEQNHLFKSFGMEDLQFGKQVIITFEDPKVVRHVLQ